VHARPHLAHSYSQEYISGSLGRGLFAYPSEAKSESALGSGMNCHIHPVSAGTSQEGRRVSLAVMNMVGLALGMEALAMEALGMEDLGTEALGVEALETEVQIWSECLVQGGVVGGSSLSQAALCSMHVEAAPVGSEKFEVGEGSRLQDAVKWYLSGTAGSLVAVIRESVVCTSRTVN